MIPPRRSRWQAGRPLKQGRYDFLGTYYHDFEKARARAQAYADQTFASASIFDRMERRWIYVYPAEYRCHRCSHILKVPPETILSTVHCCEHCAPEAWDAAVRQALEKLTAAAPDSALLLPFLIKVGDTTEQIDSYLVAAYLGARLVGRDRWTLGEAGRV
ncbi:MAG: hypothetical protein ACK47B_10735 [Armatimonadota bacterium]